MTEQPIPTERITALREKMKENVGWTDEELDGLTSKHWTFINRIGKTRPYKMIAEVVQVNDHCELKPKTGDKYVFTGAGMLIPEESTYPGICLWALAGIYPMHLVVMDRMMAGLDPNEILRDQVCCRDSCVRDGGLGSVVFRVYCEKV